MLKRAYYTRPPQARQDAPRPRRKAAAKKRGQACPFFTRPPQARRDGLFPNVGYVEDLFEAENEAGGGQRPWAKSLSWQTQGGGWNTLPGRVGVMEPFLAF